MNTKTLNERAMELINDIASDLDGDETELKRILDALEDGEAQWVMQELDVDDLDETLRGELEEPEIFEVCAAAELNGGFRTGQLTNIAYCDKTGRAGLIFVGSGSSGVSVWTDADSAQDALLRYLTDDIIN